MEVSEWGKDITWLTVYQGHSSYCVKTKGERSRAEDQLEEAVAFQPGCDDAQSAAGVSS